MKKFKWPWSKKEKKVKRQPIDISDFKEDVEPLWLRARDLRGVRDTADQLYQSAKTALWDKIEEIIGHELPGRWNFNAGSYLVTCKNEGEAEVEALEPSPFPSYEEHWKGLQATFYPPKE